MKKNKPAFTEDILIKLCNSTKKRSINVAAQAPSITPLWSNGSPKTSLKTRYPAFLWCLIAHFGFWWWSIFPLPLLWKSIKAICADGHPEEELATQRIHLMKSVMSWVNWWTRSGWFLLAKISRWIKNAYHTKPAEMLTIQQASVAVYWYQSRSSAKRVGSHFIPAAKQYLLSGTGDWSYRIYQLRWLRTNQGGSDAIHSAEASKQDSPGRKLSTAATVTIPTIS